MHRSLVSTPVLALLLAAGCRPDYVGAERADLTFYAFNVDGSIDEVDVVLMDPDEVQRIVGGITDEEPERTDCGYSGSITLEKQGRTLWYEGAEFNLHPDCAHVVFPLDGERAARRLSPGARDFLRSLYAEHVSPSRRMAY
jgi:hypothetical protein